MNVVAFIVSFLLFAGGFLLMGYADTVEGFQLVMFAGGIIMSSLGVFIPIHVLKRLDA